MSLPRIAVLLLGAAVCPVLQAQYTVGKLIFKNSGSFQQKDLEAATGLHSGQSVSTAAIQSAAQRLMNTGYFADVGAGADGPSTAMNISFILKPFDADKLTTTGFENFVWLTPAELSAALSSAAPLFHGQLPDAGNQIDAITEALQKALAAKGVNSPVTHDTLEPSINQPVRAIEFRVDQPFVRVHTIALQGVSPDMSAAETKLAEKLRGTPYSEGLNAGNTANLVLEPYQNAGYLDARLTDMHRVIAENTPSSAGVDVTASVNGGQVYHVSSFTFAGAPLAPAEPVMAAAKLHSGDLASRKALIETLKPIDDAYRHKGYMDVFVNPGPKLDPAAHTVSYQVTVTPGEQYRLRTVNAIGLSPEARKDFERGWLMKSGELYDPLYASDFFKNNTALRALEGYAASFEAAADSQTHMVDLTIKFVRTGR